MRVGSRVLISEEAAAEWRRARGGGASCVRGPAKRACGAVMPASTAADNAEFLSALREALRERNGLSVEARRIVDTQPRGVLPGRSARAFPAGAAETANRSAGHGPRPRQSGTPMT